MSKNITKIEIGTREFLEDFLKNFDELSIAHKELLNKVGNALDKYNKYEEIQKRYKEKEEEIQKDIIELNKKVENLKEIDKERYETSIEMKMIMENIKEIVGDNILEEDNENYIDNNIEEDNNKPEEKKETLTFMTERLEDDTEEDLNNTEEDEIEIEEDEIEIEEDDSDIELEEGLDSDIDVINEEEEIEIEENNDDINEIEEEEIIDENNNIEEEENQDNNINIGEKNLEGDINANLDLNVETEATVHADGKIEGNLEVEMETDKTAKVKLKSKAEVEGLDDMGEVNVEHTIQPEVKVEINSVDVADANVGNVSAEGIEGEKVEKNKTQQKTEAKVRKDDEVEKVKDIEEEIVDGDIELDELELDDDIIEGSSVVKKEIEEGLTDDLDNIKL